MQRSLTLLALFLCLDFASCNKPAPILSTGTNPNGASTPTGKKLRLAFVTNNNSDYWAIARDGSKAAEKELSNVSVDFQILPDGTASTQKRVVDDLLTRGVDGIAISPVDPSNQTEMLDDAAKQCLLVTQDSDAPASSRAFYLGTDNVAAGHQAGDLIKQALPAGGKVVVFVGSLDAQNAHDRLQGIQDSLQDSKVTIIDQRTDDTDHVRAKANAADIMVKYPDASCLVGLWSYNGPAIYNAVKEANKVGTVKIVCFDEEEDTLVGIRDGAIFGTVVQQPYEIGKQSIELMNKDLSGDKSFVPADKKIIVPTLPITKDKVDAFADHMKGLRGQ